jgi:hypothetical protein
LNRLEGGGGRGEDDRELSQLGSQDPHIPCIIDNLLFLLKGSIVFLINNHQTKVLKREKKPGAGSHNDVGFSLKGGLPNLSALRGGETGMPLERRTSKSPFKAIEPLAREGNFRKKDKDLLSILEGCFNSRKVNLCFAGSCDAIQKERLELFVMNSPYDLEGRMMLFF